MWIETKAACEAAAFTLGKKQTTIPAYQEDETPDLTDPPYCAYYPDGLPDAPIDSLWFLSPENTGPCTPTRECICLATGDVLFQNATDSLSSAAADALPTLVVVVIAAALLWYFCWQYKRRPRR